ncbi:hypothetical protein M0R72_17220 [Candidatus Pacearchaeota archaeon]|jgi:predicted translin family RNA/ssDNA-binding protein|nr:hypothetical protein [Candidatus Pacearchaeota archaeon]
MTNGKIEKAIAILSTASGLHSIEDARELIDKAERYLRDEPNLVPALRLSRDMISEAVDRLSTNMPENGEEASERAKKIHICESALLQIVEYAKSGLAARRLGSQEVAESILAGNAQRSLNEFEEVATMKQLLKENGATMEVRLAK